jgi:hypothetical protein
MRDSISKNSRRESKALWNEEDKEEPVLINDFR